MPPASDSPRESFTRINFAQHVPPIYRKASMVFPATVRHHTLVPLKSSSEQRIIELCYKVIALPEDSPEFDPAIQELKAAIHQQMEDARRDVAKLAVLVARDESQAAD